MNIFKKKMDLNLKETWQRVPGQSVGEKFHAILEKEFELPFLFAGVMGVINLLVIVQWMQGTMLNPFIFTAVCLPIYVYAVVRVRKAWPKLKNYKFGQKGEQEVGHILDGLKRKGYEIIHDLPGDGFNIDHILVGPSGVFAIETKAVRKPENENREITFDGEVINVPGRGKHIRVIKQALDNAKTLHRIIQDRTGKAVFVIPILAYPVWLVNESNNGRHGPLWVLNPRRIEHWLKKEDRKLSDQQVTVVANALFRYLQEQDF